MSLKSEKLDIAILAVSEPPLRFRVTVGIDVVWVLLPILLLIETPKPPTGVLGGLYHSTGIPPPQETIKVKVLELVELPLLSIAFMYQV